ncbi:MAG: 50S ribosomal protein L18 [Alphaproteobacteria bacterium]
MAFTKRELLARRAKRVRYRIRRQGVDKPRLSVFRSSRHMYVQLIDDAKGHTVAAASTLEKDAKVKFGGNIEAAAAVGKLIAKRAKAAGVENVVFDRGGFKFHGRVKALADAAREGGLKF